MSDDPTQTRRAALISITDLVVNSLSDEFEETEILNAIQDIQFRFGWKCHDHCFVYSRSTGKWSDGQIVDIVGEDIMNKEWLKIKYDGKRKEIQRFSSALLPIEMDKGYRCNEVLRDRILKKLRETEYGVEDKKKEDTLSLVLTLFVQRESAFDGVYSAPNQSA